MRCHFKAWPIFLQPCLPQSEGILLLLVVPGNFTAALADVDRWTGRLILEKERDTVAVNNDVLTSYFCVTQHTAWSQLPESSQLITGD